MKGEIDTTANAQLLDQLYAGLAGRPTPESVAAGILRLLDQRSVSIADRAALQRAARYADYSSMAHAFAPVVPAQGPADSLAVILGQANIDAANSVELSRLLDAARTAIGASAGHADYKHDRLDRAARAARGMDLSRRRYDKLFRLVGRLETELAETTLQTRLFRLNRFAKTVFAADLTPERFSADLNTAAFVAYMAANLARRSLFTNGSQAHAFDAIAAMLFARLNGSPTTDWFAVAHVFPRADVLSRLTDVERFELLAKTHAVLADAAAGLEAAALGMDINYDTMTVSRGQDSSTWNALAGAWNKARDYWIALVAAQGAYGLFDSFLPGKVLRLIAADVMSWHHSSGDSVHPDTPVAAELPRPWAVMTGQAACGRALVEEVCRKHGVEPQSSGWSAPRVRTAIETWRPTPETVHGVIVASPALAVFLRKVGAFSGYGLSKLGEETLLTPFGISGLAGWTSEIKVAERDGVRPWAMAVDQET